MVLCRQEPLACTTKASLSGLDFVHHACHAGLEIQAAPVLNKWMRPLLPHGAERQDDVYYEPVLAGLTLTSSHTKRPSQRLQNRALVILNASIESLVHDGKGFIPRHAARPQLGRRTINATPPIQGPILVQSHLLQVLRLQSQSVFSLGDTGSFRPTATQLAPGSAPGTASNHSPPAPTAGPSMGKHLSS